MVPDTRGSVCLYLSQCSIAALTLSHITGPLLRFLLPPHYTSLSQSPFLHLSPPVFRVRVERQTDRTGEHLCSLSFIPAQSWACCWSWGWGWGCPGKLLETSGREGTRQSSDESPSPGWRVAEKGLVGPHRKLCIQKTQQDIAPPPVLGLPEKS